TAWRRGRSRPGPPGLRGIARAGQETPAPAARARPSPSRLEATARPAARLNHRGQRRRPPAPGHLNLVRVMTCQVCGKPLPEGARFCPNCGAVVAPLLETEERKMVTVLFADLVDSTVLAQQLDAERSREFMGRFFQAATEELQALRGRPEKFIGDAVMAVFGLPQVHEDDALRAVH